MFKSGDLVDLIFDRSSMNFNRYEQQDFLQGICVVVSGPYKQRIGISMISETYDVRFQDRSNRVRVPASMLKLVSPRKD